MEKLALRQCNGTFYFQYQKIFQTFDNLSSRLTEKFVYETQTSCPWLFCKDLVGHFGCVNAIQFSRNGGEYLASGGDDTRILVWKLAEAVKGQTTPRCLKAKHLSNIFCVSFDSRNKQIISAGNDDQILVHDFETGELKKSLVANDATYDICIHPENDNIFIIAGEHGEIDLYDLRTPTEMVHLARGPPTYHSAVYNPVDPAIFVTASSIRGVELWDARVPLRSFKRFDSNAGVQCAMGVAFDQTGQYLAAVRRKLPPVLYHMNRNTSLVEFFQEGYYNSCTMKSVCFGGKNDDFIISGSDDFKVYVWDIPMVEKDHEGIAKVEKCLLSLQGHRSIVNQVCFNNATSMICSAGVEKIIKMWSPFPLYGGTNQEYRESQRRPYSRLEYARMIIESGRPLAHDYDDESTSEDPRMIAFFDSLVQKEHDDSSTTSNPSSDEDSPDESSANVNVLRRIRAMLFEQLRNERDEEMEEDLSDTSRAESPERNPENNETLNSETLGSNNVNETEAVGIGLVRLREIITSQQGSTINARRRIAALRRECLTDEDGDGPATSSTALLRSNQENQETNSSDNSDNTKNVNNGAVTSQDQKQNSQSSENSTVTETNSCFQNNKHDGNFGKKNRTEKCVSESQKKDDSSKYEYVSDLPSSENYSETHDNECTTRNNEDNESFSEEESSIMNNNASENP